MRVTSLDTPVAVRARRWKNIFFPMRKKVFFRREGTRAVLRQVFQ